MIRHILDTADQFVSVSERDVKKVPLLRGKSIFNVFFENSTRTRTTFEIAAKRLSGRRDQPQRGCVLHHQGRDAARHGVEPAGDGRGHVHRAPLAVGRARTSSRAT
jgi:hypothetical protein